MKYAAFIIATCLPSLALAGPDVARGVHQPLTYVVDGVSMVVACYCDLEEAKVFEIGIESAFENLPQAAKAGLDVAQTYCRLDHDSVILPDTGAGDFQFAMRYEVEAQSWYMSGRCA